MVQEILEKDIRDQYDGQKLYRKLYKGRNVVVKLSYNPKIETNMLIMVNVKQITKKAKDNC